MRTLTCPSCGAPIAPAAHEARVRCIHCGANVEVTSEHVTQLAGALQRAGIRVAPNLMTQDDIRAEIAERQATAAAERKRAILTTSVLMGVLAIVAITIAALVIALT